MRWDKGNSVAVGTLITLIAMHRFFRSVALGVTGGRF